MKALTTIFARFIFALVFLVFGMMHIMKGEAMAGMIPEWLPGAVFWVYLTGLAMIAAAFSIILRVYTRLAMFLLALMLLIFIFTIHLPGLLEGNQSSLSALLKDAGLMAGALIIAGQLK